MTANRLYFAQHGLALNKEEYPSRPLSRIGIEQTNAIAHQLKLSSVKISQIFHSGKLRAEQTAEIFAEVLNIPNVCAIEQMSPNDDVQLLAQNLNTENTLYVGHLPHLNKLVSYLVSGDENVAVIDFTNSAVACLQQNKSQYQLQWIQLPE